MKYVHHLPGRLRVRAAALKQETMALAVKNKLSVLPGVEHVRTNLVAGSAIVHYHPSIIGGDNILAKVSEITGAASPTHTLAASCVRCRQTATRGVTPGTQRAMNRALKAAGLCLLETAVEHSVKSLVFALI